MKRWQIILVTFISLLLGTIVGWIARYHFDDYVKDHTAHDSFLFARIAHGEGEFEEAINRLTYMRALSPEWYGPDYLLGKIFLEQECAQPAAFFLRSARRKYDDHPDWSRLPLESMHSGEIDEMLGQLESAI